MDGATVMIVGKLLLTFGTLIVIAIWQIYDTRR